MVVYMTPGPNNFSMAVVTWDDNRYPTKTGTYSSSTILIKGFTRVFSFPGAGGTVNRQQHCHTGLFFRRRCRMAGNPGEVTQGRGRMPSFYNRIPNRSGSIKRIPG